MSGYGRTETIGERSSVNRRSPHRRRGSA